MPYAVTHFLIPAVLVALFRDTLTKKQRRKFPLHYVLIAGLAGLIPDLDIGIYYILLLINPATPPIHGTFTHTIFVPLIFFILAIIFAYTKINNPELGKHKLKISIIFYVMAFATLTHLLLDATAIGSIMPLYPFYKFSIGLNTISRLPTQIQGSIIPVIDAIILTLWLIYIELKHKISDFI